MNFYCISFKSTASDYVIWTYKHGRSFKAFSCAISEKLNSAADDGKTEIKFDKLSLSIFYQ